MIWKQLFARKTLETLHAEAAGENRLRRVLGPISLTSLGIGAIIGSGIFVMTGRVAAVDAGPAIMLSFVVAGVGCLFAAFCYAEFASMAPVAGSAYTYAYATLGEMLAWIIGWDLILEYAMACAVVAAGWTHYLDAFLDVLFGFKIPMQIASDPFTHSGAWFNLPAVFIVLACTVILVIGIRESATTNAILVGVKVGVVLFVIAVGFFYINTNNWTTVPDTDRITPEQALIPEITEKQLEEKDKLGPDKAAKLSPEAIKKRAQRIACVAQLVDKVDQKRALLKKDGVKGAKATQKLTETVVTTALDYMERLPALEGDPAEQKKEVAARTDLLIQALVEFTAPFRRGEVLDAHAALLKTVGDYTTKMRRIRQPGLASLFKPMEFPDYLMTKAEAEAMMAKAEAAFQKNNPILPAEGKLIAQILEEVHKEAPKKITEKWGLLGTFGLNERLEKVDDSVRSSFAPYGLSGIIFGASLVFFAYIGFDAISTHSEEAIRPQRDVPFGILASLVICTVLYILVAAVITGMEPYYEINQKAAVATAFSRQAQLHGNSVLLNLASLLISVGALAGLTSVLLITFLSQARIFLAMARDGLLPPRIFGAIHERFRTPHISTMLTGGIIAVVAALTPIEKLEEMVNIGTLLAFVIVCAAVLLLRIRQPHAARPFRTPFLFVLAPLGIVVNLTMMLFLPLDTWWRLVIWLAVGLIIYFSYGIRRSTVGKKLEHKPTSLGAG